MGNGNAFETARQDLSWFKQHAVTLMAFGFTFTMAAVGGVTAWNALTAQVAINADEIDKTQARIERVDGELRSLEHTAEERRAQIKLNTREVERAQVTMERSSQDFKTLGNKVDGVAAQVQVLQERIDNTKKATDETKSEVGEIRQLLQRYLVPPTNPRR